MQLIYAIILGIIEGLTEFIPVSSTGHLILFGHWLGFEGPLASTFEIFIQLGAILAVVILYWKRWFGLLKFKWRPGFDGLRGIGLLALTSLPMLMAGFLFYGTIKERLFNPYTVAIGLGLGGLALLLVECFHRPACQEGLDAISTRQALAVGLFQCLALWPGVSRSASTILGGMLAGIDRKAAAEYSFFAAAPALAAASGYDLLKNLPYLQPGDAWIFGTGFVVAFLTAWVALKVFMRYVSTHTLTTFGWYRLIVAALVLVILR